jgi:hypothetical protein
MESKIHPQVGINVSSSGAFEQSASSSGPDESELEQNPFQTTLTIAGTMRYKRQEVQVFWK